MNPNIEKAFHDYEALIAKENKPAAFYNGIYTRYENPHPRPHSAVLEI